MSNYNRPKQTTTKKPNTIIHLVFSGDRGKERGGRTEKWGGERGGGSSVSVSSKVLILNSKAE